MNWNAAWAAMQRRAALVVETKVDISEKQKDRMAWLHQNAGTSYEDLGRMFRIGKRRVAAILKQRGAVRLVVKTARRAVAGDCLGQQPPTSTPATKRP